MCHKKHRSPGSVPCLFTVLFHLLLSLIFSYTYFLEIPFLFLATNTSQSGVVMFRWMQLLLFANYVSAGLFDNPTYRVAFQPPTIRFVVTQPPTSPTFPTRQPTRKPTASKSPTRFPTSFPTKSPTRAPTQPPPTLEPTKFPFTRAPTEEPTPRNLDLVLRVIDSVNGNDLNGGTKNRPYKTLDKALQEAELGQPTAILLRAGSATNIWTAMNFAKTSWSAL